ncbi:hypothetical protein D3C86_2071430 [compost metagenome]
MAASIGRPAVPPGSPSSLNRYWLPSFQAQQLCEAPGSDIRAMKACASSMLATGAAWAMKRLFLISSRYSAGADSVKGIRRPAG